MKHKCFVAMALGHDDTDAIFDLIKRVCARKDVDARRVDRILHNDDIDDKITEEIKSADLVIADLTYARPSVYFEAGYAERAPTPVIYTCRRDHLARGANDNLCVHFDLGHRNIVAWGASSDRKFSAALSNRIVFVLKKHARPQSAFADPQWTAVREFRDGRVEKVTAGQGAMPLTGPIKSILHVVPLSSADPTFKIDLGNIRSRRGEWRSLHSLCWTSFCHNPEGFLFLGGTSVSEAGSYLQVFHSGAIEAVYSDEGFEPRPESNTRCIRMQAFEEYSRDALLAAIDSYRRLSVEPPVFVLYALCGIKGMIVGSPQGSLRRNGPHLPLNRDTLLVQEPPLESLDADVDALLHPMFDEVWNASGWPGSPSWDSGHKWLGS